MARYAITTRVGPPTAPMIAPALAARHTGTAVNRTMYVTIQQGFAGKVDHLSILTCKQDSFKQVVG